MVGPAKTSSVYVSLRLATLSMFDVLMALRSTLCILVDTASAASLYVTGCCSLSKSLEGPRTGKADTATSS